MLEPNALKVTMLFPVLDNGWRGIHGHDLVMVAR